MNIKKYNFIKSLFTYFSLLTLILACTTDGLDDIVVREPGNISFSLSVTAGSGGSVSPTSGTYNSGSQVTITATANSGYLFDSWSNGSTSNPITVTMDSNKSLTASFVAIPTYNINLIAGEGGSVSGGGSFQDGVQITLIATPDSGYQFTSWSDGSTEQNRNIVVSQDLELTANFSIATGNYTLTVASQDGGTVSSTGGIYEEGTEITLTATANDGYAFTGWSNGVVNQTITIVINSNTTITANFEIIPPETLYVAENGVTIIASPTAAAGSTASLNGNTYLIVDETQLRAKINSEEDLTFLVTSKVTNMSRLFDKPHQLYVHVSLPFETKCF